MEIQLHMTTRHNYLCNYLIVSFLGPGFVNNRFLCRLNAPRASCILHNMAWGITVAFVSSLPVLYFHKCVPWPSTKVPMSGTM